MSAIRRWCVHGVQRYQYLTVSVLTISVILFIGCTGDSGPVGPAGPQGNSDIRMSLFDSLSTTTGVLTYTAQNITGGLVDSSLVPVYFNPSDDDSTTWYPCPGLGPAGISQTRSLFASWRELREHSFSVYDC